MPEFFKIRSIFLLIILVLATTAAGHADDGCLTERGRIRMVNIAKVAVSGHLVTSLQRGNWNSRPTVRVGVIRQHGAVEIGVWKPGRYVADIELDASTAFVAADGGLFALDLLDPSSPVELSYLDLIDAQHLAVDGNHAYFTATGPGGDGWFDVVDISDPTATERLGGIYWPQPDPPKHAIDASGNTVVIADDDGLLVLDVSDALNPETTGRWNHPEARDVALVADHAVVTFAAWAHPGERGITVVDLSDPNHPTPVGTWAAPSEVLSVAEYGGAVAVGTESDGVFLIDIEDPVNPMRIDHRPDYGMRIEEIATAWPTMATANLAFGTKVLGLHPSCLPPRHPSDRVRP